MKARTKEEKRAIAVGYTVVAAILAGIVAFVLTVTGGFGSDVL